MAEKALEELFHANLNTNFDETFWNNFVGEVAIRIRNLQGIKIAWDEISQQGIEVALERINQVLGPAAERIQNVAELGFLTAPSTTSVTLAVNTVKTFIITEGDQRDLFTPSPFLAVTRSSTANDFAIGRLNAYDRTTGVLEFRVDYIHGSAGPFTDWIINSVPGTVIAENEIFSEIITARDTATTAKEQAIAARDATLAAAGRYWGALASPPAGASIGHQYLDTTTVPNLVKVLTSTGWAPTVTVSIGGAREQDYATTTTGTGPFTVDGGFTRGQVWVNGSKLRNGVDVTLAPGASGTFTLTDPLVSGDEMTFIGYLANDATDIYTKSEANALLAAKASTSYVDTKVLSAGTPVGTIIYFATSTAPDGYLVCNGAAVSNVYPDLRALLLAAGSPFGTSGADPKLPDLRGEFMRGWDNGRGIDTGRVFGSSQLDQFQGYSFGDSDQPTYDKLVQLNLRISGNVSTEFNTIGTTSNNIDSTTAGNYAKVAPISNGVNGTPRVGSETRPRNVALMPCIKAYGAVSIEGAANLAELLTAIATQAEAEAGTDNTKLMTPLRTKQAISSLVTIPSMVRLNTGNGQGSSSTAIHRFTNVITNQGSDITYADSATFGGSFTINVSGIYAVSFSAAANTASYLGITRNTAQPTARIDFLSNVAEVLAIAYSNANGNPVSMSWVGYCQAGDVIRAHGMPSAPLSTPAAQFTISRILK